MGTPFHLLKAVDPDVSIPGALTFGILKEEMRAVDGDGRPVEGADRDALAVSGRDGDGREIVFRKCVAISPW